MSESAPILRGQKWKHKRRELYVYVNTTSGSDVQVLNVQRTSLRWLSQKGFLRDYAQFTEAHR